MDRQHEANKAAAPRNSKLVLFLRFWEVLRRCAQRSSVGNAHSVKTTWLWHGRGWVQMMVCQESWQSTAWTGGVPGRQPGILTECGPEWGGFQMICQESWQSAVRPGGGVPNHKS